MTELIIPITERFEDLDKYQRVAVNYLITEVAKHQLSFEADEQGKRSKDINSALDILKVTLEAKPERIIS
tara:strand:- start:437 stop:646 length:210 start_codon:yes stop_codon:yes gene_type:complete